MAPRFPALETDVFPTYPHETMDEAKLRIFKEEIMAAIQTDQKFNELRLSIGRLVSHVESEQKMQVEHGKQITALEEELIGTAKEDGLRAKVKTIHDHFVEGKRTRNAILVGVVGLVIERGAAIVSALMKHVP